MSVSLITGIGEKVSPGHLTTRGDAARSHSRLHRTKHLSSSCLCSCVKRCDCDSEGCIGHACG